MKLHCDRAALTDAMVLIASAAAKRSPRPQLTCALLTATAGEGLKLAATDGEISLQLEVPMVDVTEFGATLIPAQKFLQILRSMDDATVKVEAEEGEQCQIIGEASVFRMFAYKADDFPPMPEADMAEALAVPAGDFKRLVSQTTFAVSREVTRYSSTGVLVRQKKGSLEMLATDGKRAVVAAAKMPKGAAEMQGCIVPTKALAMLEAVAGDDETIRMATKGYRAVFMIGEGDDDARAVLETSLLEGTFPPVDDVIPKQWASKATCNSKGLVSALQQAQQMTNEETRAVVFAFSAGSLELSASAPEMGDAAVQVQLSGYEGPDLTIGFNPRFIADAAKAAGCDSVSMEFGEDDGRNKPCVIRGAGFVCAAMPIDLKP